MSSVGTSSHRAATFLGGLRVLELGDGVAGAAAAALLAALGASVTTVVEPNSAYRLSRPTGGQDHSLLALLLEHGKQAVELDPDAGPGTLATLLGPDGGNGSGPGAVDVVVVDRVDGMPAALQGLSASEYAGWVTSVNRAAWVTISAFGLSGPRRDDTATELTLAAASGVLASVRDARTGQPLKLAGYQSLLSAGQAAALAACHAVDLASDGRPAHLDLSAQEATIATGPMLALAHQFMNVHVQGGAKRYGAPASFYACKDGLIRISAMEDHQWRGVVTAMGSPAWAERFATTADRIEEPEEIDARIAEWTAHLTKAEAEARLQAEGVPATAMYSPAEILASPQLDFRGAIERTTLPSGDVAASVSARPFTLIEGASGDRRRRLRGLRVLEAGHVLAVPLAGALLGALGAEVVKLEDVTRIDMYRRRGPFIDGQESIDRAAYFAMVNHSKKSATMDLDADVRPLWDLIDRSDVVIENLGRRRADRLGISASALARSGRDLLAVSSSGFGHRGPQAEYRAYAYNLQTSFGLMYLTRNEAGEPAEMDMAWADLVSAYALATMVAAWAVAPEGAAPASADFAMSEVVAGRFNEFLAAASLDPAADTEVDRANELSPFAPNGVYRTANGWVALSVPDDLAFDGLRRALGNPEPLSQEQFSSRQGRFIERVALDAILADGVAAEDSGALVTRLRRCGVLADPVVAPSALADDEHLAHRAFFTVIDHPEWGRRQVIGIPWRPEGTGPIGLSPPPLFDPNPSSRTAAGSSGPQQRSDS